MYGSKDALSAATKRRDDAFCRLQEMAAAAETQVKYKGVYNSGQKFQVVLSVDGKSQYGGTFDTPKEAAEVYDRAAIQAGRPISKLNFPDRVPEDYTPKKKKKICRDPPPMRYIGTGMTHTRWRFLVNAVASLISNDRRNTNLHPDDLTKLAQMDNAVKHELAGQIADRIVQDGLLKPNATDVFGGYLAEGLIMRAYGGIFQLSIDRLTNKCPTGEHFIHFPNLNNAMENIRLVPLALNMGNCGRFTLEDVQQAVRRSTVNLEELLEYESITCRVKGNSNLNSTLYSCCHSIWGKDELARIVFKNRNVMWKWARERLRRIGGRCEISRIPLRTNETCGSPFQMSIDAIDPCKQHVPSNMRIVCRFLNPICMIRRSKVKTRSPGTVWWTPELFRQYFRIGES